MLVTTALVSPFLKVFLKFLAQNSTMQRLILKRLPHLMGTSDDQSESRQSTVLYVLHADLRGAYRESGCDLK